MFYAEGGRWQIYGAIVVICYFQLMADLLWNIVPLLLQLMGTVLLNFYA